MGFQLPGSTANTDPLTVYTPPELQGNFSAADPGLQADVVQFLQANPQYQANAALAAQSIIDPTKIDPVAQKYIVAGLLPTSATGILTAQSAASDNRDEFNGRFDFQVTKNDRVSLTVGRNVNPQLIPFTATALGNPRSTPGFPVTTTDKTYFLASSWAHTFGARALNEFRFTTQRQNHVQDAPANPALFYDILKAEDNFQFNGQAPFFGTANLLFSASAAPAILSNPFVAAGANNPFPSKPASPTIDFTACCMPFGGTVSSLSILICEPHTRTNTT